MEDNVGLLFSIAIIVASLLAFYIALPRGGEVARFLRNDHAQSYYVVLVLSMFVIGAVSLVASLTALDPLTGFQ